MNEFAQGAAAVGGGIAGFLNPLFGSETSTTTVTGSGGETPQSSTKPSTMAMAAVIILVIGIIAFLVIKNKK